jgi:hypothetical protein
MRTSGQYASLFNLEGFWEFVEFVDTHGWHKADPTHPHFMHLSAIGAYLQSNRPNTPRDTNSDVTDSLRVGLRSFKLVLTSLRLRTT